MPLKKLLGALSCSIGSSEGKHIAAATPEKTHMLAGRISIRPVCSIPVLHEKTVPEKTRQCKQIAEDTVCVCQLCCCVLTDWQQQPTIAAEGSAAGPCHRLFLSAGLCYAIALDMPLQVPLLLVNS